MSHPPSRALHASAPPQAQPSSNSRAIGIWLLVVCVMIFGMVLLGAVTRLTHSGLSMVEWRPVTGWLPPLTEAAWQAAFDKYKLYPEFQKVNAGITLAGYKAIFWLEYVHRVWGRLLGIAFAVPFVVFLRRRWIPRSVLPHLVMMFVLGGLQGFLGWYMVKSGMVNLPDVSHLRLTAHLAAAVVLYLYILWVALTLLAPLAARGARKAAGRRWILVCSGAAVLTFLSGGLVAGLNAGFVFNDFPLMAGRLIPDGLLALSPAFSNFFDNVITVQFQHRVLGLLTWSALCVVWWFARRSPSVCSRAVRAAITTSAAAACVQVCLGILTLWLHVPTAIAATHQACGLVLLTTLTWTNHELWRQAPSSANEKLPAAGARATI